MQAYQAALDGAAFAAPATKRTRGALGTFDDLVQLYLESSDFAQLAPSTQRAYKLAIERLVRDEDIGHRLVRQMERKHGHDAHAQAAYRRLHDRSTPVCRVTRSSSSCSNCSPVLLVLPEAMAASSASFEG